MSKMKEEQATQVWSAFKQLEKHDYVWLIHNSGGIELNCVRGPFHSQRELERGIVDYLGDEDNGFDEDSDTLHTLSFDKKGPRVDDFSGGFMDEMREKAGLSPAP